MAAIFIFVLLIGQVDSTKAASQRLRAGIEFQRAALVGGWLAVPATRLPNAIGDGNHVLE
jgi:hypothetical protein